TSLVITLARQLVILIPLTYGLMKCFGIQVGWYAFVVTEFICTMYSLFEWRKIKR
ncbi:MAG: MATE family efflux transporter, partial [Solobacterium sp.]|nr:MATE family efflux transporter [Solobacterium sp.]